MDLVALAESEDGLKAEAMVQAARRFTTEVVRRFLDVMGISYAFGGLAQRSGADHPPGADVTALFKRNRRFEAGGLKFGFASYKDLSRPDGFDHFEHLWVDMGMPTEPRPSVYVHFDERNAGYWVESVFVGNQYHDMSQTDRDRVFREFALKRYEFEAPQMEHPSPARFFAKPANAAHRMFGVELKISDYGSEQRLASDAAAVLVAALRRMEQAKSEQRNGARQMAGDQGPNAARIAEVLRERGYHYTPEKIATFYAALKAKGFVILSGLSGAGKTLLARQLVGMLGTAEDRVRLLPVRADWHDSSSVLGFRHPFNEKYQTTPALELILSAVASYGGGAAEEVEDIYPELTKFIRDPGQVTWHEQYGALVKHFSERGADELTGDDLRVLWDKRRHHVANLRNVGVLAHSDEELRSFTARLLQREVPLGLRFATVHASMRDTRGKRQPARIARALAVLEPSRVPAIVSADLVNQVMKSLGEPQGISLTEMAERGDHTRIEQLWALLTERGRELAHRAGLDAADPAYRTMVLYRIAQLGKTGPLELDFGHIARPSDEPQPHFLILDEMNLARVEYYFADFLSALESGRLTDEERWGLTEAEIDLHSQSQGAEADSGQTIPARLRLPPNLYVIGTVNIDETTFTFSPKVLDRAFTIEFNDVDLDGYPAEPGDGKLSPEEQAALRADFVRGGKFTWHDKKDVRRLASQHAEALEELRKLNRLLPQGMQMGMRAVDDILAFLGAISESSLGDGLGAGREALDVALVMKVLPKLSGPYHRLKDGLQMIIDWAESRNFSRLADKTAEMKKRAEGTGNVSFS